MKTLSILMLALALAAGASADQKKTTKAQVTTKPPAANTKATKATKAIKTTKPPKPCGSYLNPCQPIAVTSVRG